MRFIEEIGGSVKPGQQEALQEWLVKNEDALAKAYPEGSEYLGTYVVIYTSGKDSGQWRTVVRRDSYAALDQASAVAKDPNSDLGRLTREFIKFFDPSPSAPWSRCLYKAVVDATVFKSE
jgi:hypothetical protein